MWPDFILILFRTLKKHQNLTSNVYGDVTDFEGYGFPKTIKNQISRKWKISSNKNTIHYILKTTLWQKNQFSNANNFWQL